MQPPAPFPGDIRLFRPPYEQIETPNATNGEDLARTPGAALVWPLFDSEAQRAEYDALHDRSPSLPLIVLLPPAREIHRTLPMLNAIGGLYPRAVLPGTNLGTPDRLALILATPPRSLADAVTQHLVRRGVLPHREIRRETHRILELAPEVSSISRLARRMYTSRRTLGRHFGAAGLPVPSHWLQFCRLLHVAVHLQNDHGAIFRIAARAGYADGFTMSNQMKRLTGYRPSDARKCLGWEWIVEAWLRTEAQNGGLSPSNASQILGAQ